MHFKLLSVLAIAILLSPLPSRALPPAETSDSDSVQPQNRTIVIIRDNFALNRAKNLARRAGERVNGGLSAYRAEMAMHGDAQESPFKENEDGSVTFTFKGRKPDSTTLTIETVVTVSRDAQQITVDYNGPIRSEENTETTSRSN